MKVNTDTPQVSILPLCIDADDAEHSKITVCQAISCRRPRNYGTRARSLKAMDMVSCFCMSDLQSGPCCERQRHRLSKICVERSKG